MENWTPKPKSPLGALRNRNEEVAQRVLTVEHIPLESRAELLSAFSEIAAELKTLQMEAGVPEMSFESTDVRLVLADGWEELVRATNLKEDNGAFWDSVAMKVFIRFDPESYESSRLERVIMVYIIAHELAHKIMPNGEKYSYHLNEGLADTIAQDVLEHVVLPRRLATQELEDRKEYVRVMQPYEQGFALRPEDLLISDLNEGAVSYGRIPQLRLVQRMRQTQPPAVFIELRKQALLGNPDEVRRLIATHYGSELAGALHDPRGDMAVGKLISMVRSPDRP